MSCRLFQFDVSFAQWLAGQVCEAADAVIWFSLSGWRSLSLSIGAKDTAG